MTKTMEFPINVRVYPRQTPSLYLFIGRVAMRTFHGRSMLCLLIERALSLTEADRQRYGLLMMGTRDIVPADAKPRRFSFILTAKDHPEAARKLEEFGQANIAHARFIHLLEVAAGLMYADSQGRMAEAAPLPAFLPPPVQLEPPPPVQQKPAAAKGDTVFSTAHYDKSIEVAPGAMDALFGLAEIEA